MELWYSVLGKYCQSFFLHFLCSFKCRREKSVHYNAYTFKHSCCSLLFIYDIMILANTYRDQKIFRRIRIGQYFSNTEYMCVQEQMHR